MAGEMTTDELKVRLYDAAVALGEEQQKTRLLIGILKGLTEGDIDLGNIEVNADATSVSVKNADLVAVEG